MVVSRILQGECRSVQLTLFFSLKCPSGCFHHYFTKLSSFKILFFAWSTELPNSKTVVKVEKNKQKKYLTF
ncbi:hypothetical protein KP13_03978 (plasmid) [Klebsiella pneumoniae subsp. pneumoniae Kp13]|nr:hypothetical protein KP13_03978 [Klebsiella pneumoniae subsp. pneumoniae Kp13]